jgi:hypothetical protein
MAEVLHLTDYRRPSGRVYFERKELRRLLALYAERVALGEWRDYAIDCLNNMAAFAVFGRSGDWPVVVVAKFRAAPHGPANYAVSCGRRRILSQGRSIDEVLAVLARKQAAD